MVCLSKDKLVGMGLTHEHLSVIGELQKASRLDQPHLKATSNVSVLADKGSNVCITSRTQMNVLILSHSLIEPSEALQGCLITLHCSDCLVKPFDDALHTKQSILGKVRAQALVQLVLYGC